MKRQSGRHINIQKLGSMAINIRKHSPIIATGPFETGFLCSVHLQNVFFNGPEASRYWIYMEVGSCRFHVICPLWLDFGVQWPWCHSISVFQKFFLVCRTISQSVLEASLISMLLGNLYREQSAPFGQPYCRANLAVFGRSRGAKVMNCSTRIPLYALSLFSTNIGALMHQQHNHNLTPPELLHLATH
jgi:hypothetical protein